MGMGMGEPWSRQLGRQLGREEPRKRRMGPSIHVSLILVPIEDCRTHGVVWCRGNRGGDWVGGHFDDV